MPLVLNEDQNMLKDSAKNFCSDNTPITQLRRLRDDKDESGFDRDTWRQMVELGWAGITVPEDFGGLGFGYMGLGVVMEECGVDTSSQQAVAGQHQHDQGSLCLA